MPQENYKEQTPYPWIVHPVIDLLFVCGGLPLLLITLNVAFLGWRIPFETGAASDRVLLALVLFGQHFFADAHNMATHLRIWGSAEDRDRFAFYRIWLSLSCVPLFVLGLAVPAATSVFVYLYLIVVFWHYAAQAYGISLIYCAKRGYLFTKRERLIYKGYYVSLSATAILRFVSFRELSPTYWFGIPLPFWGPVPGVFYKLAVVVFFGCTLLFAIVVVRKLFAEKKLFPLPSALIMATLTWLGVSLGLANALLWIYVPAFFHGSQYLAVCVTYFLKDRGIPEGASFSQMGSLIFTAPAGRFVVAAVVSGALFYVAIPYTFARFGFDFAIVAGLVLAVVNYHHFITDAAIWRLRDPRYRKLLLT
ncbi:MAG: hypothetical protein U0136_16390 [Bdellovibrionota bacterium]